MTDHPIPRMPIRASPYAHQQATYEMAMRLFSGDPTQQNLGVACLMEMGTGKSLVAITTAGAMYQSGRVRRLLVVCPKTIMGVWNDEFAKFADFGYELTMLTGSSDDKAKRLKALSAVGCKVADHHGTSDRRTMPERRTALQTAVINYESAWRIESELIKWRPDMIVADEGHKLKSPQASVSKSMHRLGAVANYKMLLTGTPVTNKPLDVFSQYKFVNVDVFGANFYAFRNRYFDMVGFGGYEPLLKKSRADEFTRRIHSIAFRATKAECLDLPETIDIIHHVDLEPSAAKIYRNLAKDSWTELQSLSSGDKPTITATNILTKMLRLSQCAGGFATDDEGGVRRVSTAKLEALHPSRV
jgi:SNF2 family DNA or RNA helicase